MESSPPTIAAGASGAVHLLLVEDSVGDARLTQEAFRDANRAIQLHLVSDGVEAMAFLRREGEHAGAPRPDLILLDLNLPRLSGDEVLALIKADENLRSIPVVILATSDAQSDITKSYALEASCYLTKPVQFDAFRGLVRNINAFWLSAPVGAGAKPRGAIRILLIEDNPGDARLLWEMLREQEWRDAELTTVSSLAAAEQHLRRDLVDVILLDLGLPDAQGLSALRLVHAAAPTVALVVLTGLDDETQASRALQEGAQDYLIKGQIDARSLLRALRYSIERKAMEEALFVEKERAQVTLNSIGDAVICTDVAGNVTFLNLVAERMTGWPRREAEGRPMSQIFRIVDAATREVVADPMPRAVIRDRTVHLPSNSVLIHRDGHETPIEDSVAPIHDREGQGTGAVIVFRDVSAARAMAVQLAHSAEHDFLTGLPNRLLLSDRVNQAITVAARHQGKLAVLFLDLDGFKHINDSLGHPIGDRLLQSVAQRLVDCVRDSDTVSRQGGDEYVVLLSEVVQVEDAAITARRMLQEVARTHTVNEHDLHISASIGVSVYPDDGLDAATLIKSADTAMYQAKVDGRQSYQFFKSAMNIRAIERQFLEENLRRGLERQEFTLHYQPKVNLRTGAITGAEALLRWKHPVRGFVAPAQFIPVAEDSGLILPIGSWALREACTQMRAWMDTGLVPGTMAVHISAMQFRDGRFVEKLLEILKSVGLDPHFLELELTESVLMKRAESAAAVLRELRATGIRVAVDDFGTGYSSLSYLSRFSVDALKIDQSFVRQITRVPADTGIVRAVISMSRSLQLTVVAEGIETADELEFLRAHGCDEGQGYYFSRPLPPRRFTRLLETGIRMRDSPTTAGVSIPASAALARS